MKSSAPTASERPDPESVRAFRGSFRSLLLATSSAEAVPEASYAPFVMDDEGRFYVLVSELARHTSNLLVNPFASLLLVEEESGSRNVFARKRLSYVCRAQSVSRQSTEWTSVLARFEERFGAVVDVLRGLPDFHLFRLSPTSGSLVQGFGQAYRLVGDAFEQPEPVTAANARPTNDISRS